MTPKTAPANASTALAELVLDVLIEAGVRELVLAPGSRSAALAFAAEAADQAGRLRLHTRIDERSAGFLGLGLAKSSRRPVAVVTTSGTAAVNLHPAVLEAHHSGVRLIAVTADRPARLRGSNANQTTNQAFLFGEAVRGFTDVAPLRPGEHESADLAQARQQLGRAVSAGIWQRGPVQLNVQFDPPLVPGAPDGWAATLPSGSIEELTQAPTVAHDAVSWHSALNPDSRGVVVAGDEAGKHARLLAEALGWPLLAEPSSGARYGVHAMRTARLLLGSDLNQEIETVVVCGHPTLSRPVTGLISREDVAQFSVAGPLGATDPGLISPQALDTGGVSDAVKRGSAWLRRWQQADARASAAVDAVVQGAGFSGYVVAELVAQALPDGGSLFVGASNPIRDLDLMMAPARVGGRRLILANRGLAGIDGSISTAIGAALGRSPTERPHPTRALGLLGDVTFLHEAGGLVRGPEESWPDLQLVVVNDDGGSIFALLEQGEDAYAASFERLFATPHGVDLGALCAASKTPHRRVLSAADLRTALAHPIGGVEVVEAVVPRQGRRLLDLEIRGAVRAALAGI